MRAALCACFSNTAVVNVGDGVKHDGVKPPTHLQERGRVGREGRGGEGRGGEGGEGRRRGWVIQMYSMSALI